MTFDNNNRGTLFKNDRKETPKHPDYRGSLNVAGVDYWVSGWIKQSKAGQRFVSLSVKLKAEPESKKPDLADDVPF